MRIVFICSSLDPGKDGAGDQARRIASELSRQGNDVSAVSLNEPGLAMHVQETQAMEGAMLEVLRLPGNWPYELRYQHLSSWIKKFDPEWVSLQFVNFGFHRYGLPLDLVRYLPGAIGSSNLHIMFQELWCGEESVDSFKVRLLGVAQKCFIKLMLVSLKPKKVFTNISSYRKSLRRLGVKADLAPVFGNIPLDEVGSDEEWQHLLASASLRPLSENPRSWLVLGFFGTVYPCPGVEELIKNAELAAEQIGRKLGILMLGHGRGRGAEQVLRAGRNVEYWKTGPLSAGMLNRTMQLADLSVATTSSERLNKSSTSSAWQERGIPVLISGRDSTYSSSEMLPAGAYQVRGSEDVLLALHAKGNIFAKHRFRDVVASYAALSISAPCAT